jgi:hypothetical protein
MLRNHRPKMQYFSVSRKNAEFSLVVIILTSCYFYIGFQVMWQALCRSLIIDAVTKTAVQQQAA